MLKGICAGFGASLWGELLMLDRLGIDTVRQDLQSHLLAAPVDELANEFNGQRIRPLFIVDDLKTLMKLPEDSWVELMNEPDLKMSPRQYANFVGAAHDINEGRCRLFSGSISNLGQKNLAWLRDFLSIEPCPNDISVHRYPEGVDPYKPHKGFNQRVDEVLALKHVIMGRPFIVTEFGYHTGKRGWWIFSRRLSESAQRDCIVGEFKFWERMGAEATYLYQLNDAPEGKSDKTDRYGIRTADGRWKLSAQAFRI